MIINNRFKKAVRTLSKFSSSLWFESGATLRVKNSNSTVIAEHQLLSDIDGCVTGLSDFIQVVDVYHNDVMTQVEDTFQVENDYFKSTVVLYNHNDKPPTVNLVPTCEMEMYGTVFNAMVNTLHTSAFSRVSFGRGTIVGHTPRGSAKVEYKNKIITSANTFNDQSVSMERFKYLPEAQALVKVIVDKRGMVQLQYDGWKFTLVAN